MKRDFLRMKCHFLSFVSGFIASYGLQLGLLYTIFGHFFIIMTGFRSIDFFFRIFAPLTSYAHENTLSVKS